MESKNKIIDEMIRIHDEIKQHPFRLSFSFDDSYSYKHLLGELTKPWGELIYRCNEIPEDEKIIYRKFGDWIHDYWRGLQDYINDTSPLKYFDYYERMLQVTHRYIETGSIETYYNLNCKKDSKGNYTYYSARYDLITKEKTGIDSPDLPGYFRVDVIPITDDNYIENLAEKYKFSFQRWKIETKPILEWINIHYYNAEVNK